MTIIHDKEFGDITVRRNGLAKNVTIRVGTDGQFVVSAPRLTPLFYIKSVIATSRHALNDLAQHSSTNHLYTDGRRIGKHHTIAVVRTDMVTEPTVTVERSTIVVKLRPGSDLAARDVQRRIRETIIVVLRREAKQFLPGRLAALAAEGGFQYDHIRFSHAAGRWGSCSSRGTISLNIALMKLPDALIDYVLIHELCHTRHMNHSAVFWELVGNYDSAYRLHRRQLKRFSPNV